MSKQLDELIEQTDKLSMGEKQFLANHLLEQVKQSQVLIPSTTPSDAITEDLERRKQHIQWIKDHQAKYADKYVALDGYCLVGEGDSYSEAYEAAKKIGVKKPFITQVFPPDSLVFGGW